MVCVEPDVLSTHVPVLFWSFFFFFFADYKVSSCLSFVKSRELMEVGEGGSAQAEPTEGGHSAHLVIVCLFAPGQRRQKGVAGPAL